MVKGEKFRIDCRECGHAFFTSDRKANFCSRCAKKVAEREKHRKKTKEDQERKKNPLPDPSRQAPSSPPPLLTDELQGQILEEYELYKEQKELPKRKIHGLIGKKLRIPKMIVAKALRAIEGEISMTEEMEKEIVARYQKYVQRLEKPPQGRRKTIAKEMNLPYRTVIRAVRKWTRKEPSVKDLTREQRFGIEKAYFRGLQKGQFLSQIRDEIMRNLNFSSWQVSRYLDLLHDGENRLKKVSPVTSEQKEAILAGYREYLSASAPPAPFLHSLLAEKAGVTHQQVHRVVLAYRLDRLKEIQRLPEPIDT